jgi:dipeptidyl aminopeptidase/acylaminoacyl peptidase
LLGKVLAAAAALMLAATMAQAAPLEAYGKLPHVEDVAISPKGSVLAIALTDGEARSIILRDLAAKTSFRLDVGATKLRDLNWVDEDNLLITASSTAWIPGLLGPRREYFQAFLYNRPSGQLKLLLRDAGDSMNVVAAPPVVRNVGGETKIFAEGFRFVSNRGRLSLFEISVNGVRSRLVGEGFENTRDWLVGPDGAPLAQVELDANDGRWTLRVKSGPGWKAVKTITTPQDAPTLLGLGRDGQSVLIGLNQDEKTLLQEYSIASEAWGAPFTPQLDGTPLFDPATHALTGFQSLVGDELRYEFLDPAQSAAWARVQRLYKGQGVRLVSSSADRSRVVVLVDSPTEGPTYALVDFNTKRADWLAGPYPDVPPADIAEVRPVRFKASDGLELSGYLTLPKGRDPKKLPLIVNPHGGPASRDAPGFDWWSQAMASRGYAVLRVNFRGSSGFGRSFMQAGFGEWGRKMQSDLSDGVRMLASEGTIDPERVCIVGASYGGYAALAGVTLQRGIYRCAASVAGVSDLRRMVSWSRMQNGVGSQRYWVRFMGAEDPRDPVLRDLSPSEKTAGVTTPVLLVHGRDDTVVPLEQTSIMEKALKSAGAPTEVVIMPGEDHWLSRGETRLRMLQAVMSFVEKNNPPS